MKIREEKLKTIIDWSKNNNDIRAVLLTSSLVNPLAPVDELSDIDIELIFKDNKKYILDNSWVQNFGKPIAIIEEDEASFENIHAIKMVLYGDYVKVDFKLYNKTNFLKEANKEELPQDWDIGYKVLIDKDEITKNLKKPTHKISIIKKPTEQTFNQLLKDFWWDATYVAKSLVRDELFYAKISSENVIRTNYLIPLIEWHIANQYNWNITTNKYGRLFKKYVSADMWQKIEHTFSGSSIEDNWDSLFAITDLVSEIGRELSKNLKYEYPIKLENDIKNYLKFLRTK